MDNELKTEIADDYKNINSLLDDITKKIDNALELVYSEDAVKILKDAHDKSITLYWAIAQLRFKYEDFKKIEFYVTPEVYNEFEKIATRVNRSVEEVAADLVKDLVKSNAEFNSMKGNTPIEKLCRMIFNDFEKKSGQKFPATFEEVFENSQKNAEQLLNRKLKEDSQNG